MGRIKPKIQVDVFADLFCGAGGTTTGAMAALDKIGRKYRFVAVNHWDIAIETHSLNHPDAEHACQSISSIHPEDLVPGRRLKILFASPECTDHSNAKGGKPRSDQKRADAWLLMRWIQHLYVENLVIENVKEFVHWGPLTAKGRPDKRYRGEYFRQFIAALEVNYTVEYKILNAADFGDATTRERFFLIAKRGKGKKIFWPARTHVSRKELAKFEEQPDLFNQGEGLEPWRSAREIIDWELEGRSIFNRKKPLSDNTMRRIFAGLFKYSLKPFIVPQFGSQGPRDIEEPTGTITTTSRGVGLVDPYLVNLKNTDRRMRNIDEPTFTQCASGNHQMLIKPEAFTVSVERPLTNRSVARPVEEPIATITGTPRIGLVEGEAFTISAGGPELPPKSVDEPMRTILTRDHQALVETTPFVIGQQSAAAPREVSEPIPTVAGAGAIALVEPQAFLFNMAHNGENCDEKRHESYCKPLEEPLPTVAGKGMFALLEPYLIQFFGESAGQKPRTRSVEDPTYTITTQGRMGVAEPFIVPCNHVGDDRTRNIEEPLNTVTTRNNFAVAEPFITNMKGQSNSRSVDDPLYTQTTKTHQYLAEPYIVKFYSSGENVASVDDPLGTVTTKERFGLCIPQIGVVIDIRFRMLQPHELSAAMSFPKDYKFAGNREAKVKQIGNAVPVRLAEALCRAVLEN